MQKATFNRCRVSIIRNSKTQCTLSKLQECNAEKQKTRIIIPSCHKPSSFQLSLPEISLYNHTKTPTARIPNPTIIKSTLVLHPAELVGLGLALGNPTILAVGATGAILVEGVTEITIVVAPFPFALKAVAFQPWMEAVMVV